MNSTKSPKLDGAVPSRGLVTVVDLLLSRAAESLASDKRKLQELDTSKLLKLLSAATHQRKRVLAFLASQELTLRGVPPCFRDLPEQNDDDPEQLADLMAIDLDWIAQHYPAQKMLLKQWQGLTSNKEATRLATIRFICNWQVREMWRYVKGLAMTEAQEWECHYLQRDKIRWARIEIERRRNDVADKLRQRRFDRKLTLVTDEELADFERWLDVWSCASMGAWSSPTRVSWLYEVKTGKPLSRQMAAKIVGKLRRDLPSKSCRL